MSYQTNHHAPIIERISLPLKKRQLTVTERIRLTPNMVRIVFSGNDLSDFESPAPDDHVKLFIPGGAGMRDSIKRDYTPRYFDQERRELVIDFVVHDGGPAVEWAQAAAIGDTLEIGGPRGSQIVSGDIKRWLLIGDETALPAIGRRVEALDATTQVQTLVLLPTAEDEQALQSAAAWTGKWLIKTGDLEADIHQMVSAVEQLSVAPATFVWVAGEASLVGAVKQTLLAVKQLSRDWIKAAGYWKQGEAE